MSFLGGSGVWPQNETIEQMNAATTSSPNYPGMFRYFLIENGYPGDSIIGPKKLKVRDITCDQMEIEYRGQVIQSFALMSESDRSRHKVYPFYKDYEKREAQKPRHCNAVKPPCSIAFWNANNEQWEFFDASDSHRRRPLDTTINYNYTLDRFLTRWNNSPVIKLQNKVKCITAGLVIAFSTYFLIYLMGTLFPSLGFSIPFDSSVLTVFVLISILLLFPVLVPYIKKISSSGAELDI